MTARQSEPQSGPPVRESGWEPGPDGDGAHLALPPAPVRPTWTFLTNHGHVLLAVAADPEARVADLAARVGITPRATLQILKDLEDTGYLHRVREGRRTRYALEPHQHFRHPAVAHREIDGLIGLFAGPAPATAGEPATRPGPADGA